MAIREFYPDQFDRNGNPTSKPPRLDEVFRPIRESSDDVKVPTRLAPEQEKLVEQFTDRLVASLGGPMDERHIGICEKILRELLVRSEKAEGEPADHITVGTKEKN